MPHANYLRDGVRLRSIPTERTVSAMLDEFIEFNRVTIIASAAARVAARTCPEPSDVELTHAIPVFLEQFAHALALARSSDLIDHEQIERSAGRHRHALAEVRLEASALFQPYTQRGVDRTGPGLGLSICVRAAEAHAGP